MVVSVYCRNEVLRIEECDNSRLIGIALQKHLFFFSKIIFDFGFNIIFRISFKSQKYEFLGLCTKSVD